MAIYEYKCSECGKSIEITMLISDYDAAEQPICDSCGNFLSRAYFTAPAVQVK